jgi:Ca2+-transporting ATPase
MEEKPRDSEEIITKNLAKVMGVNIILMVFGAALVYFLTFTGYLGIVQVTPENISGFWNIFRPSPTDTANFFYNIDGPIYTLLKSTTMLLSVILIVESVMVLLIRRINLPLHKSLREPGTWIFVIFLGLIYAAHLLLMYVPQVNEILSTFGLNFYIIPLSLYDWLICIVLALPAILGVELFKQHFRNNDIDL